MSAASPLASCRRLGCRIVGPGRIRRTTAGDGRHLQRARESPRLLTKFAANCRRPTFWSSRYSPDGTGRWCDEESQRDSQVHCLHRSGKLGLARPPWRDAIRHRSWLRLLLNMNRFQPPSPASPAVLAAMGTRSGRRGDRLAYVPGGEIVGWPWRRCMSRGVNAYARLLLDCVAAVAAGPLLPHRARQIDFDSIRSRGYCFRKRFWLCQRQGPGSRKRRSRLPIARWGNRRSTPAKPVRPSDVAGAGTTAA